MSHTKKPQNISQRVRARIGDEVNEILKHAESQVAGNPVHPEDQSHDNNQVSPIAEAIQQTVEPPLNDEEKVKRQRAFIQRVEKANQELDEIRKKEEEKLKSWAERSDSEMKIVSPGEPIEKGLEIPRSKPARGKTPTKPGTEPNIEIRKGQQ